MGKKINILFWLFSLFLTVNCFAEEKAFSSISIAGAFFNSFPTAELEENWDVDPGLSIFIEIPTGFGNARAGLIFETYNALTNSVYDYDAFMWYFGWNYPIKLFKSVSVVPGLNAGSYTMSFDVPGASFYSRNEAEYFEAVSLRLQAKVYKNYDLYFEVDHKNIFTYHNIEFNSFQSGVIIKFRNTNWIRDVLN